jgi:hypothetical protein
MGRGCWIEDLYGAWVSIPLESLLIYVILAWLCTYVNIDIAGDKSTATKAIVEVYDIFGPSTQTLQGADLVYISTPF